MSPNPNPNPNPRPIPEPKPDPKPRPEPKPKPAEDDPEEDDPDPDIDDVRADLERAVSAAAGDHSSKAALIRTAPLPPGTTESTALLDSFAPVATRAILKVLHQRFGPALEKAAREASDTVTEYIDQSTLCEIQRLVALLAGAK